MFLPNKDILAFTSDTSIDFTPTDFDAPLTNAQQQYLKTQTGFDIPTVFWRKQVHEDLVLLAEGSPDNCRGCPDADAYVTNQKNLPIAIRTADCVPVFIYDPQKHVIGLAHAGWKGTTAQIAAKTIKTMQDKYKCQCYDLKVAIGPAIRSCCYQVGAEFKEHFPLDVQERSGHLYYDMATTNKRQLLNAGILPEHIEDLNVCTCCSLGYFSFRRDGAKAGRMISLMMLL